MINPFLGQSLLDQASTGASHHHRAVVRGVRVSSLLLGTLLALALPAAGFEAIPDPTGDEAFEATLNRVMESWQQGDWGAVSEELTEATQSKYGEAMNSMLTGVQETYGPLDRWQRRDRDRFSGKNRWVYVSAGFRYTEGEITLEFHPHENGWRLNHFGVEFTPRNRLQAMAVSRMLAPGGPSISGRRCTSTGIGDREDPADIRRLACDFSLEGVPDCILTIVAEKKGAEAPAIVTSSSASDACQPYLAPDWSPHPL